MKEIIRLRELNGVEVLDAISCAYISKRFFTRSRAWFIQRLNNNIVNGQPVSFTPEELLKLRAALNTVASELTQFTTQIPKLPTAMTIKVYVVTEPALIEYLIDNDLEGFKAYLEESKENDDFILFEDPECFDTEAEALAFCDGIGYGADGHATPDHYPLRTTEETDLPFIEAIEGY